MTVHFDRRVNRWVYDFWLLRRRYQGYCIDPETQDEARSKRAAKGIEADIRAREKKRRAGGGVAPGTFSLAEACAAHLSTAEAPRYRRRLSECIAELIAFFGETTAITAITGPRILEYRTYCSRQTVKVWCGGTDKNRRRDDPRWWKDTGRPRSKSTCNRYLDALSGAFSMAYRMRDAQQRRYLADPPEVPRFKEAKRNPTPLRDGDLAAIEQQAKPWVVDGLELARLFGLRHTEIGAVTVAMIDEDLQGLRLPPEITKSGHEQIVLAGRAGWELLKRLRQQATERHSDHLVTWPGIKGMYRLARGETVETWAPVKSMRRAYNAARRRAGFDPQERRRNVHDVRARYITEVSSSTKSEAIVREAARHADYRTTQRYIEVAQEELRQAIMTADARREERAANDAANIPDTKSLMRVPDGKRRPTVVRGGKS